MRLLIERLFLACFRALDVWLETVLGNGHHVDPPDDDYPLRKGSLWHDEPTTVDDP